MSLIQRAKEDWRRFTSNTNEFGVALTLISPEGVELVLGGLGSKHHIGVDEMGNLINTKNAHCSFSESILIETAYPCRVDGEVKLQGHKVRFNDSRGESITYVIQESFPDETVGFIVCILGDII